MRIPDQTIKLKDYHHAVEVALADPATPVYIDTSVLMWLIRVGTEARREFLNWCRTSLAGRVVIPTWALHELYHHLREGTIPLEISQKAAAYKKNLSDILSEVSLTADSAISVKSGYATAAELVAQTRERIIKIHDFLTKWEAEKARYDQATAEVVEFANDRLISSRLFSLLDVVSTTRDIRIEGRIPPGYKDAHKPENAVGDLVLWQEVLKDLELRSPPPAQAIIITKDEKSDWYCKPFKVEAYDGKVKGENHEVGLEAKLPHPMLEHELKLKTNTTTLFVINPRILAVILDKTSPKAFQALTMVTHPKTTSPKSTGLNYKVLGYPPPPEPPEEEGAESPAESPDLSAIDFKTTCVFKSPPLTRDGALVFCIRVVGLKGNGHAHAF